MRLYQAQFAGTGYRFGAPLHLQFAINPTVGINLTCPVKEALGEEAFEIYFSRGRMSVLKSILEGSIPLSKKLADFVYQCTECGKYN